MYTTGTRRSRATHANGTATPAPVVSRTPGRTAPSVRQATRVFRSRFFTLRFVGECAYTTCSSRSSDRASLLSNVTQTCEYEPQAGRSASICIRCPPDEQTSKTSAGESAGRFIRTAGGSAGTSAGRLTGTADGSPVADTAFTPSSSARRACTANRMGRSPVNADPRPIKINRRNVIWMNENASYVIIPAANAAIPAVKATSSRPRSDASRRASRPNRRTARTKNHNHPNRPSAPVASSVPSHWSSRMSAGGAFGSLG